MIHQIHNLKLFWKFALLALMTPITITIIASIAFQKTNTLKYEYDNLYGFMLIPLLDIDLGNLHREKLSSKLHELTHSEWSPKERTALAEAIRAEEKRMIEFIARYESEWLTTLSPEFTASLAALGQQHLQTIEAETLAKFHVIYNSYALKRDALLAGKTVNFNELKSDLEHMETTFDSLVKVNRKFADYSNESAQNAIAQMRWMLMVLGVLLSLIALGIAWWFAHLVTAPVVRLSRATQQLAQGNLDVRFVKASKGNREKVTLRQDEIGDIERTFDALISYFQQVIEDIVHVSQELAEGHLSVRPTAEYRGDFIQIKKALETALSNQRRVIEDIIQVSQGVTQGNWHIKPATAEYRGDFVRVKNALESAAAKLAESTTKNIQQNWLKTGQNQLNDQQRGEQNVLQLAEKTINFITPYVQAACGIFYLFEQEPQQHSRLKIMASHAYTLRKTVKNEFKLGEGVVGKRLWNEK
ncbi:MAG TPA: HAMP domain-containing protein [Thioploca sp.]|nr:MAG: hypothetical protein B6247_31630 [Beggiatoa sp. 4572_84]RKZ45931.1 MAG: hypothetical protein DRR08_33740 [Gammaproteobacteria bacterium]HDN27345.1 HAMP domain-containing protein [Thioploca sp.]